MAVYTPTAYANIASPIFVTTSSGGSFYNRIFIIDSLKRMWGAGDNTFQNAFGPLGAITWNPAANAASLVYSPVQVPGSWNFISAWNDGFSDFNIALNSANQMFSWGINDYGELGINSTLTRSSPTAVGTSTWTKVIASGNMSLARRSDGTLWSWGSGYEGQLGNSSTIDRSSPVQVPGSYSNNFIAGSAVFNRNNPVAQISTTLHTFSTWGYAPWVHDNSYLQSTFESEYGANATPITNWGFVGRLNRSSPVSIASSLNLQQNLQKTPIQITSVSNWSSIAAGEDSYYAINNVGQLFTWGFGTTGELGHNNTIARSSPTALGTSSWAAVAAGQSFAIAIDAVGRLFGWGRALVNGTAINRSSPILVGGASSFAAVYAGSNFAAALDINNRLFTWGNNADGQLGDGTTVNKSSPVLVATAVTSAALGREFLIYSKQLTEYSGKEYSDVYYAGKINDQANWAGRFNIKRSSPVVLNEDLGAPDRVIKIANNISKVSVGHDHTLAIDTNNKLYSWGNNFYGQLGQTTTLNRSSPVLVDATSSFTMVAAGREFSLVLKSSNVIQSFGRAANGILGLSNVIVDRSSPVNVGSNTYSDIFVTKGTERGAWAVRNNELYRWGHPLGPFGLNDTTSNFRSAPTLVANSTNFLGFFPFTNNSNAAATQYSVIIDSSNIVRRYDPDLTVSAQTFSSGTYDRSSPVQVGSNTDWTKAGAGDSTSFAINTNGELYAWGLNSDGQLGLNDLVSRSSPIKVGTSSWATIASTGNTTYGLTFNNRLYGWGLNSIGQVGDNSTINRSTPTLLSFTSWINISTDTNATIATRSDNKIYGWGINSVGQLGINDTINRSAPTLIGESFTNVVRKGNTTYAIKDETLYNWGQLFVVSGTELKSSPTLVPSEYSNFANFKSLHGPGQYELGNSYIIGITNANTVYLIEPADNNENTTTLNITPVLSQNNFFNTSLTQLGSLSYSAIGVGRFSTFGISNNALYAWGRNDKGQLGDGSTINRISPVIVSNDQSWTIVAGGINHTIAKTSNTVYVWGGNESGQLGLNTTTSRSSPTALSSDSGSNTWVSLAAGYNTTAAISNTSGNNILYTWGLGTSGQLGQNSITSKSSPVSVSVANVTSVDFGLYHGVLVSNQGNNFVYTWGNNQFGQLGDNTTISKSSPVNISNTVYASAFAGDLQTYFINGDELINYPVFNYQATGFNQRFNLGNGIISPRSSPVTISTGINKIAAKKDKAVAISNDKIFGWGNSSFSDN